MAAIDDIETIAAGCVWAHKEICLQFNRSWADLGDVADVLTACHANKDSFLATSDDDQLLAFYRQAVRLLADDVGSLSKIATCISALDAEERGRIRECYIGWVGGVACLAILRFYRDTQNKPTTVTQIVSVKATMMPNLTTTPWDMSTVDNLQMAVPMTLSGRFKDEPGAKRAVRSTLCWLRDYIDGHAVLKGDICWSEEDPGSEFYQQQYRINVLSYPFFAFWDEALEAIATKDLVGIMCIIPEAFRGVATVGSGFVNFAVPTIDPKATLSTAEFLAATLNCMFVGWASDYDVEHGILGGNGLGLWCPTTRDRISQIAMDRHRPWIESEVYWRAHMSVNVYYLAGVRHFAAVRRTIGCSVSGPVDVALFNTLEKIDSVKFGEILNTIGLSEEDATCVGPVTVPRPCEGCYSLALMTELFALTTGIVIAIGTRQGGRG